MLNGWQADSEQAFFDVLQTLLPQTQEAQANRGTTTNCYRG